MNHYVHKKVHPPLYYYGGKSTICRRILERAPDRPIYVEPFAGGLSVLLNKYRSDVEVASDVSTEIIHFYHVLIDHCEELIDRLQGIPYSRATYLAAVRADDQGDDLTRAVNCFCRQRMSFSGRGGWSSCDRKKTRWHYLAYDLRIAAERLQGVQILNRSAFDIIPAYDSEDTLFYCDPPYYRATRFNPQARYLHEFSEWDHLRLLKLLQTVQGSVILSGYDCSLYNKELAGWNRAEFSVVAFCSLAKDRRESRRTEVLWVKPNVRQD